MNWGRGLLLALVAFGGLMAWFVVQAMKNPEPLVTEQYYERELAYQSRIDAADRAAHLSSNVRIAVTDDGVRLQFPPDVRGAHVSGDLHLMRPNDPTGDRDVVVNADTEGTFASQPLRLRRGRYNAELAWSAGGVTYYYEAKLLVP